MNDDYLPPVEDVVFSGIGPQEQCIMLEILNDDLPEETESFKVFIQSSIREGVILEPNSTQVFIMSPEGEISRSKFCGDFSSSLVRCYCGVE